MGRAKRLEQETTGQHSNRNPDDVRRRLRVVLPLTVLLSWSAVGNAQDLELDADPPESVFGALDSADWSGLREAFSAGRHTAYPEGDGFIARNPGQRWETRFDGRGSMTVPDRGGWSWGLELQSYGFAGRENAINSAIAVRAEGGEVTYEWDDVLHEWYRNDARGLEHGFTVLQRPMLPEGVAIPGHLTFTLEVQGGLVPKVQDDGRGVWFVDDADAAVLTYSGLTVFDADGRALPARLQGAPGGLRLSVDEEGARYPLTIDPVLQQTYLKASNTGSRDEFGWSVAASGNTVAIGAYKENSDAVGVNGNQNNDNASLSGAVYVFVRTGALWTQEAYIKASNTERQDAFGYSVALSGDTLVVSAPEEDSGATGVGGDQSDNSVVDSGAAYVFVRNGSTWSQQAYLKASNTGAGDWFGYSVAISDDTLVVGALFESSNATGVNGDENNNSFNTAGAAYVFARAGSTWSQEAYLKASNTSGFYRFGIAVAVSGDTVVVGSSTETGASPSGSGAAYVFTRVGASWSQGQYLKASNAGTSDRFGISVAVSGDTVVVGAFAEDSNATGLNGNEEDNSATSAGAAYIFERTGTTWIQDVYLKASNTNRLDNFGIDVALSGDRLVVGAWGEASNAVGVNGDETNNLSSISGAAYLFMRHGTTWCQEAYLKPLYNNRGDYFGNAVAVSGSTAVVGVYLEDSRASGVNGDPSIGTRPTSGAAYIFDDLVFASTASRNAGSNPLSYSAAQPVLGSMWTATVDLSSTGHDLAQVFLFSAPTSQTLGGGQVLLIGGTMLSTPLSIQPGPQATWSLPVPNDLSLVGILFHTQAIHFSGVTPYALSNAQDLVVGY